MSGMHRRDAIKAAKDREQAESRDDLAARIAHRLTCNRCAQGWYCGGRSVVDYELGAKIADLLTEARAEALLEAAKDVLLAPIGAANRPQIVAWLRERAGQIGSVRDA